MTEELIPEDEYCCDEIEEVSPPIIVSRRDAEEETSEEGNASMWSQNGRRFFPCEKAVDEIPPGQYTIKMDQYGTSFFERHGVDIDELLILPDSASDEIIKSIEHFWSREDHYRKFGFLWKRGVLLHGPPGSGKTSTLQILSSKIIDRGGLAMYVTDPREVAPGLAQLRYIEPNRPIVVMIEDIDAMIRDYGEQGILAFLDGETQIDNVVFIATTNYPEKLDKRMVNRPSRFDLVQYIGMPSPEAREVYIRAKHPGLTAAQRKKWVKDTELFSVAHLKELIVSAAVLDLDYETSLERIRSMIDTDVLSDELKSNPFGFTGDLKDSPNETCDSC